MRIIKILVINLIFVSVTAARADNSDPRYVVHYPEIPPLGYTSDEGKASGLMADLFKLLMEPHPEFKYRFESLPLKRYYRVFDAGRSDFTITIARPNIDEHYFRSQELALTFSLNVYWKKGTPAVKALSDLAGKRVAKRLGYQIPAIDLKTLQQLKINFIDVSSTSAAIQMLAVSRVDYLMEYKQFFEPVSRRHPVQADLNSFSFPDIKIYFYVHKKVRGAKKLVDSIDQQLLASHEDGTISNLFSNHAR